jgi:transcriptional pleiotropic regulator of transition state genes
MNSIKHKKLTKSSGVTIPKDMRLAAGFVPGMAVDLTETEDGILISKHVPVCRFCGSPDNVVNFHTEEICAKCADALNEEVHRNA